MQFVLVDEILRDWKEEAKITHLMLYRLRNGVLTIYTDRPGPLIGKMGERIDRYKAILLAIPYHRVTEVRLEETDGIF
jgi:ribosomal protein S3